jgi:hypothetical protein
MAVGLQALALVCTSQVDSASNITVQLHGVDLDDADSYQVLVTRRGQHDNPLDSQQTAIVHQHVGLSLSHANALLTLIVSGVRLGRPFATSPLL